MKLKKHVKTLISGAALLGILLMMSTSPAIAYDRHGNGGHHYNRGHTGHHYDRGHHNYHHHRRHHGRAHYRSDWHHRGYYNHGYWSPSIHSTTIYQQPHRRSYYYPTTSAVGSGYHGRSLNTGNLVGGAVGGYIGSTIGKGSGRLAATAAGAVLGYAVGGHLGSS